MANKLILLPPDERVVELSRDGKSVYVSFFKFSDGCRYWEKYSICDYTEEVKNAI